jgi:hypothetical protein
VASKYPVAVGPVAHSPSCFLSFPAKEGQEMKTELLDEYLEQIKKCQALPELAMKKVCEYVTPFKSSVWILTLSHWHGVG